MTFVRRNFPDANAAEYSNSGRTECDAVYNATGLIYDPTLQTCMFDDSWPIDLEDRRRLRDASEGECEPEVTVKMAEMSRKMDEMAGRMEEMMGMMQSMHTALEKK